MFSLSGQKYSQSDFAHYIKEHQNIKKKINIKTVVNKLYVQFVEESCISFEDSKLEEKYPEFRTLINEYRDGILLFELTDRKVWSKAIKDTSGLLNFYKNNKTNYMWDERLHASIYTCANMEVANKARKLVKKGEKKGYSDDEILKILDEEKEVVKIEEGKFLKEENEIIDSIVWEPGLSGNIVKGSSVIFVQVKEKLKPMVKTLNEARGLVTADYQRYLEKEWIESMRKKYPVKINKKVLATL